MTGLVLLFIIMAVVVLIMRRRGRLFLESEEGAVLSTTLILCMLQKIFFQNVSLSDTYITPLYIALIICAGHARGPAQGAVCGFFSALVISVSALAFIRFETGQAPALYFPLQYVYLMIVWMTLGGMAGLREIPKPLKPLLAVIWLLFVGAYSPSFLRNLGAYITLFAAVALAALGLYVNLFKRGGAATIFYPTSPSRRSVG